MDRESEALRNFEMISLSEGNLRKSIGVAILLSTLLVMLFRVDVFGFRPSYWSFFISIGTSVLSVRSYSLVGVGVYRTGSKSQWGCITSGRWNPDGLGKREIPKGINAAYAYCLCAFFLTRLEMQKFAEEKKRQFYWDMIISGLYAFLLSCAWIFIAAPDALSLSVVTECIAIVVFQVSFGLTVSFLA